MHNDSGWKSLPAQPLTFGGVAGVSHSWSRLLLIQISIAVLVAAAIVWLLFSAWVPVVNEAIVRLPTDGSIHNGTLYWHGAPLTNLASGKFLSIAVNLGGGDETGSEADLQWELGRNDLRMRSILGYIALPYPRGWIMALNRVELEPWWGAWKPALLVAIGASVVVVLFASWSLLATAYCLPAWIIGYFADRRLSWTRAWRVSAAALLPGALLLTCAIVAYSLQAINLIQLMAAWIVHFAIGWIYLLGAPFRVPAIQARKKNKNPFVTMK